MIETMYPSLQNQGLPITKLAKSISDLSVTNLGKYTKN